MVRYIQSVGQCKLILLLFTAHREERRLEEDKAMEVIKQAKVEDDEYKNATEEQTYYR